MLRPIFGLNTAGLPVMAIVVVIGAASAVMYLNDVMRRMSCTRLEQRKLNSLFIIALIVGLLTANLANWLLFPELLSLPLSLRFQQAGFSFYFGLLGFLGAANLLLWLMRLDRQLWVNQIVPAVLLFHAYGRIGCCLEGCCYGRPVSFLAFSFDFPARELEFVALVALFIWFSRRIWRNQLAWYLLSYSVLRFLLEFGRGDDRGSLLVSWLSPSQQISVIIWVGLAAWLLWRHFVPPPADTRPAA